MKPILKYIWPAIVPALILASAFIAMACCKIRSMIRGEQAEPGAEMDDK